MDNGTPMLAVSISTTTSRVTKTTTTEKMKITAAMVLTARMTMLKTNSRCNLEREDEAVSCHRVAIVHLR